MESRPFLSTLPFYLQYREPYPKEFFIAVAERLGLKGNERLLDLGCGPAQLAIGFAPFVAECVGVDPEPEMLAIARESAERSAVHMQFRQTRAEELNESLGTFEVVTIGRAIHWMDPERAPVALERVVVADGSVLICGSETSKATPWLAEYERIIRNYRVKTHGRFCPPNSDHANAWFARSHFRRSGEVSVLHHHQVTIDDLVARALSFSHTSPAVLGDRRADFEKDIRAVLQPFTSNRKLEEEIAATASVFR